MELLSAFDFIDRDDFVHRLDPRTKLFLVIVYLTLLIMFKQYIVHLILLANLIIWIILGRMGKKVLKSIRGMAFIMFFIIFFNTLLSSLNLGMQMILRLINIIIAFSIFFQTTHPDDLTQAIAKMGVSYPIAFSFSLAFRFIPTLANEVETITKAQKSRGLVMQRGGLFQQIRALFPLLIPLITNSIKRAFYVAESLEARSFGLEKTRTQLHPVKFQFADWAILALLLVLLGVGIVVKIYEPQLMNYAIFNFAIPL
jgi:energy-coupling factor transport system permease protein